MFPRSCLRKRKVPPPPQCCQIHRSCHIYTCHIIISITLGGHSYSWLTPPYQPSRHYGTDPPRRRSGSPVARHRPQKHYQWWSTPGSCPLEKRDRQCEYEKMKRLYSLNISPWANATEATIRRMTAFMLDVDSGLSVQVCNTNNWTITLFLM